MDGFAALGGRRRAGRADRGSRRRVIFDLLRVGSILPRPRRAFGAAGPQERSRRLLCLSGVLRRSRAPSGAARPCRRGARPEPGARSDGGGPRRADAPPAALSSCSRAALGSRLASPPNGLRRRCPSLPRRREPNGEERRAREQNMPIWEVITAVSLESLGAVLAASFFVAQCVSQEAAQASAQAERP